jgi:RND family efflux transporter MFP subunit
MKEPKPKGPLRDTDLTDLAIPREQEKGFSTEPPRSRRLLAVSGWSLALLVVGGGAYWLEQNTNRPSEVPPPPHASAPSAPVAETVVSTPPARLAATGYVVAQRQASIASKGTGRLEFLGAAVGDRVTAGQLVARLERKDMDAALEQARARLGIAKAALASAEAEQQDAALNFTRAQALLVKQFVTQAEFDTAQARLHRAQAMVRSAKAGIEAATAEVLTADVQLENTNIRAPFEGMVLKKFAEVGEVVAPLAASTSSKGAVLLIADLTTMQVESEVSESVIGKIRDRQPVEIAMDAVPGRRYRGEVAQIVPTADRSKATVLVKIKFLDLDDQIRPEMSAKVLFLGEQRPER